MALPEDQPKEIRGVVKQDGVVSRDKISDCSQNGIQISKEHENLPCIKNSVPVGGDTCFSCEDSHQGFTDDEGDLNDVPDAGAAKSEKKSESAGELQNHEASSSCVKAQSISEIEDKTRREGQKKLSQQAGSWFKSMRFILVICVIYSFASSAAHGDLVADSLVGTNEPDSLPILSIVLSCTGPQSSVKNWLSRYTSIVKNGMVKQNCSCCPHLPLTETGNLNITNIGKIDGVRDLCNYQCELLPPKDDAVQHFLFRDFIQLCYVGNESMVQEFLSINGGAEFEVRRNVSSDWIYRFNVTNWNRHLEMFAVKSVKSDVTGEPYCSNTLIKREGKNESHAVKPGKNQGIVFIICEFGSVAACLIYHVCRVKCKKEDESTSEAMIHEGIYYYD